ncbi:MAG: WD40 repeat domain-containing protein [Bdellovibrionota bacterium]|nr:WD40 repeat domain-containing protein [Bdellovibrionota bacterium]
MRTHLSPLSGVATFSDQYIASAGYDNQVILWDAKTKESIYSVRHDHLANQCQFHKSGKYLISSSSDFSARLWSVPDMKLIAVLSGHQDDVEMSAFHPFKELIATASRDNKVRVYDFTGKIIHLFEGHKADVISVVWSEDGKSLISSSDDGTVRSWDLALDLCSDVKDFEEVETDTLVIFPDQTLYLGNDLGEIIIVKGENTKRLKAHKSGIKRLIHCPERNIILSLSYDRTMKLWDKDEFGDLNLNDESSLPDLVWPRSAAFLGQEEIVFSTFGTTYCSYNFKAKIWCIDNVGNTHGINAVLHKDGDTFSIGDAGVLKKNLQEISHLGSLCNFLIDYKDFIITGGQKGAVYNGLTGDLIYQNKSPLNCATIFNDYLVIGTYTGEALFFNASLDFVKSIPLHDNAIKGLSAGNGTLFSVCANSDAVFYQENALHSLKNAHSKIANGCVFLKDKSFASISRDLKLRVFTQDQTEVFDTPHENSIKCIMADTTGRYIATGSYGGQVALFDYIKKEWILNVRPTQSGISSITYDENQRRFLVSSYDGNIYPVKLEKK